MFFLQHVYSFLHKLMQNREFKLIWILVLGFVPQGGSTCNRSRCEDQQMFTDTEEACLIAVGYM